MLTLRRYIKMKTSMPSEKALDLIDDLADLLERKSGANESLPALTPERVLIDNSGDLRKVDSQNGLVNPHYLAPEDSTDQINQFKSRIYNLGAIFYFAATGMDPYGKYTPGTPPNKHFDQKLKDPLHSNPDLSKPIAALIRKMMSVSIEQRHNTLKSFKFDVQSVRDGEWPINAPLPLETDLQDDTSRSEERPARSKKQPKRQVAISNSRIASAQKRYKSKRRRGSYGMLVYILIIGAGIWAAWHYHFEELWLEHRNEIQEQELRSQTNHDTTNNSMSLKKEKQNAPTNPARSSSQTERPAISDRKPNRDNAQTTEIYEAPKQDRDSRTASSGDDRTWNDPEFLRGARLYNRTVDLYRAYAKSSRDGSPNSRALDRIESLAKRAVRHFENCQTRAPDHVPMKKYIQNCYKIIANCRQSKLLDAGD